MYNGLLILASGSGEKAGPAGPTLWGMEPYQIVAVAMLVLILVMLWKKVPSMVTGGLDNKIAAIREQLEEAKTLRAEAEALRNEYAAKIANAERDTGAMLENAQKEAAVIVTKAEDDSKVMIARRKKMAEDKIASAQRDAIDEVRMRAASVATLAAKDLIAKKHDAEADSALADHMIAGM